MDNCGYCGDPIPEPPHVCWLAGHYSRQESLEPEPVVAPLEIGWTEGDALVPIRVKQVDISNF